MANFKQYDRTQRNLTTEQDFSKGMYYTNQPLTDGAWKTMVNYDIDLTGTSVHPRPGMVVQRNTWGPMVYSIPLGYRLHHNGSFVISDQFTDTAIKYTLLYKPGENTFKLVDDTGIYDVNTNGLEVLIKTNTWSERVHDMSAKDIIDVPQPHASFITLSILLGTQGLIKLVGNTNEGARSYAFEPVEPRELTVSEAVGMGFNMLQEDPYDYNNDIGVQYNTFNYKGIVVEDLEGNTILSANVNKKVRFKALYEAPPNYLSSGTFTEKWEIRDLKGSGDSIPFDKTTGLTVLETAVTFEHAAITVVLYDSDDTPLSYTSLSSFHFFKDEQDAFEKVVYNLNQASDVTMWQRRLVLWGVPKAPNMVFVSQVEAINYFPYPNNTINDVEGRVLRCVPFMNDLLIFTEYKLYRAAFKEDGGFTVKLVQDHLHMTEFEASTVVTVKNMVFFKSGNYYYMVVPRLAAGGDGELQLAPISTPITNLLDNFYRSVSHIFFSMFGDVTIKDINFCGYNNFQDNGVVKNIYKFNVAGKYFDVYLNYSTVLRTWTMYIMESTQHNISISKSSVTYQTEYAFIDNDSFKIITPDRSVVADEHMDGIVFQNLQLLDTGYREHNTQFKKRYREIQFKVNNISKKSMQFGTEFRLDEQTRKGLYSYTIDHDGEALVVVPEFLDIITDAGQTVLEENDTIYKTDAEYITPSEIVELKTNHWQLDISTLWDVSIKKIRLKVSGKGYAPRLILVSLNLEPYELMNFNWVYRTMHGR